MKNNKKLILVTGIVAILSLNSSEVWAETWDCGKVVNTVSCTLDDSGTFTVSGKGEMADYSYDIYGNDTTPSSSAPWGQSRVAMGKIKNIVVADTITRIGNGAFTGAAKLTSVSMPGVTSVGQQAFRDAYILREISMPEVETIEFEAFEWAVKLRNVYAPKLETIGVYAFGYTNSLEYAEFADNISFGVGVFSHSGLSDCDGAICSNCGDKFLLVGKGCVSACPNNYKTDNGRCWRIRYTPAELAKIVGERNTILLYYK